MRYDVCILNEVHSNRVSAPLILREVGWRQLVVGNPDSLWKEAVVESGGLGLDTVGYSARWQRNTGLREVGGVRHCTGCYSEATFVSSIEGRETPMMLCAVFIICCRDM